VAPHELFGNDAPRGKPSWEAVPEPHQGALGGPAAGAAQDPAYQGGKERPEVRPRAGNRLGHHSQSSSR